MSPRYASALLGLTNTVGAVPGILGVATVGFLYDTTHSWEAALFMPSMACMVGGALVYSLFAVNDPVDFDQGVSAWGLWQAPGWMLRGWPGGDGRGREVVHALRAVKGRAKKGPVLHALFMSLELVLILCMSCPCLGPAGQPSLRLGEVPAWVGGGQAAMGPCL